MTLQRPPPEIRTFSRNPAPRSSRVTSASGAASALAIAAKKPAAPPPTTMILLDMRATIASLHAKVPRGVGTGTVMVRDGFIGTGDGTSSSRPRRGRRGSNVRSPGRDHERFGRAPDGRRSSGSRLTSISNQLYRTVGKFETLDGSPCLIDRRHPKTSDPTSHENLISPRTWTVPCRPLPAGRTRGGKGQCRVRIPRLRFLRSRVSRPAAGLLFAPRLLPPTVRPGLLSIADGLLPPL